MFKWLLENSLRNRLLVIIGALVLMAYGAFTLTRTPVDVFPDLNKPTVTLMTEAGGMAAEEVEQLITFPLETAMNGLPSVESVRSVRIPSGSFSGPESRTSGAMISRFRRCLRSSRWRRSRNSVAMVFYPCSSQ